jgi:hypothetical protein
MQTYPALFSDLQPIPADVAIKPGFVLQAVIRVVARDLPDGLGETGIPANLFHLFSTGRSSASARTSSRCSARLA